MKGVNGITREQCIKMSNRVSERELIDTIDSLSEQTGVRFTPNFCYGAYGVQIMVPNSAGCVTSFIGLGTKRETYNELNTIKQYLCDNDERFKKYQVSKCTHRDSLNHYEGKKDKSVMHEITETNGRTHKITKSYWCSACHRGDLTLKDFEKSKVPITFKGLQKIMSKLGAY